MFSEFPSFCFMGVSSNSQAFLPEKDPKEDDDVDLEFNLLVRSPMEIDDIIDEECQASTQHEGHELIPKKQLVQERDKEQDEDHDQEQPRNVFVPVPSAARLGLTLKIPPYKDAEREKDDSSTDDGLKTPTSSDHKIPAILRCPPAPRKPKSRPSSSRKRKTCRPRIVLDLSQEIESLFTTPLLVDLGAGVKSNKKAKQ